MGKHIASVGQHPRHVEGLWPRSALLVSRVGACWPFQGYHRHAHACTAFGLFLLSTKAGMQIQTTKEIRCLPCFSAVNGKELSSCLSEIFHFFLSTACIVSLGSSIYGCLQQLAAPCTCTVNGKLREQQWLLRTWPTAEQQTHRRFQVIFFFPAENTDLEDMATLH